MDENRRTNDTTPPKLREKQFAVIGVGNIGHILITRLLEAGVPTNRIVICDADNSRQQAVTAEFGVPAVPLPDEAACTADVILLCPSPKAAPEVLQAIALHLHRGQVVVSFAALVSLARMEAIVPPGDPMLLLLDANGQVVWREWGVASNPDVFDLSEVEAQIDLLVTLTEID